MATNYIRLALGAVMLGAMLAACEKAPPPEPPAPAPAEVPAAPADAMPAPSLPPEAPPPTEPSPPPQPTATEPDVDSMHVAAAGAKASVPVTLRYELEGEALPDQPVTVHLAAVPRVPGARLQVEVKNAAGLQIAASPMQIQKVSAATPYRQRLSVTRTASGPQSLRVLVTMDVGGGTAFGYYTIPLATGTTAQKLDSVKQR